MGPHRFFLPSFRAEVCFVVFKPLSGAQLALFVGSRVTTVACE